MLRLLQDVLLRERVRHLVLLDDDLLLEDLDGVEVVGGLLATQDHLAEGALAQHFDELKVLQGLEQRGNIFRKSDNVRKFVFPYHVGYIVENAVDHVMDRHCDCITLVQE